MATYDSLSAEDKSVIDNFTNVMRSSAGEAGRLMNHLEAIKLDSNALSIFATLDGTEVVPNRSSLPGADSLLKSELQSVYNDYVTMTTSHNSTAARQIWTKMCGIASMIG